MVKSILVVAENSLSRAALTVRLEAAGYLVVTADGRAEALEILAGMLPGAVLVDLSLPARAGRLVCDHLEANARLRMIPRLAILGAWRKNTRAISAAAVFVKPLDLDHLTRALRAIYPPPPSAAVAVPARRPMNSQWDDQIAAALAS